MVSIMLRDKSKPGANVVTGHRHLEMECREI